MLEILLQPQIEAQSGTMEMAEIRLRTETLAHDQGLPEYLAALPEQAMDGALTQALVEMGNALKAMGPQALGFSLQLTPRELELPSATASLLALYTVLKSVNHRFEVVISLQERADLPDTCQPHLENLYQSGIEISIGGGAVNRSAFWLTNKLPFKRLVLDRSLIDRLEEEQSQSLIHALVILAHQMDQPVVTKDIRTARQIAELRQLDCNYFQGNALVTAMSPSSLADQLRQDAVFAGWKVLAAPPEKVLLAVDDETNILSAIRRVMRQTGYKVLLANSAQEALEILATQPVDVVLSDQRMPGMTGVELLRQVKKLYPDTLRIMLSGYTELQSVTDAINEGAIYKFLSKPWDDEQLRSNIDEAFRYKFMNDENRRLSTLLSEQNQALQAARDHLEMLSGQQRLRIHRSEETVRFAQRMLNQMPIPIVGIDSDGMVAFANTEANRLSAKPIYLGSNLTDNAASIASLPGRKQTQPLHDDEQQQIGTLMLWLPTGGEQ